MRFGVPDAPLCRWCNVASMSYPATITIERPERMANWRPIGQTILVLPHYVILHTVLNVAASITAVIAWFSVLATGKLPPGIAAFHATYVRYRARTFSYMGFLTDKYPPFDFSPSTEDPGGAGISVSVSPRLEGKNRLNVLFRFIVPFAWLTLIGMIGLLSGFDLPAWVWIVELVLGAVLIPGAIFSMIVWVVSPRSPQMLRHAWRSSLPAAGRRGCSGCRPAGCGSTPGCGAYSMLLTDEYPPFSLD